MKQISLSGVEFDQAGATSSTRHTHTNRVFDAVNHEQMYSIVLFCEKGHTTYETVDVGLLCVIQ